MVVMRGGPRGLGGLRSPKIRWSHHQSISAAPGQYRQAAFRRVAERTHLWMNTLPVDPAVSYAVPGSPKL